MGPGQTVQPWGVRDCGRAGSSLPQPAYNAVLDTDGGYGMPTLWGRDYTRAELMERVGDLSQVGGVREYRLDGGSGDGVEAVDLDTGSGLRFTVLPGRALDISGAWYRGIPLAFRTPTGEVQGARYEPGGQGWIRTTVLGLLVTGGLTNAGDPVDDDDENGAEGLHGRLSNLGATNGLGGRGLGGRRLPHVGPGPRAPGRCSTGRTSSLSAALKPRWGPAPSRSTTR